MHSSVLNCADIEWRNNQPYSRQFGDIYYCPEAGAEEADYVFLQGNQLQKKFSTQQSDCLNTQPSFAIAELGFGSSLNFLATAHLWQKANISSRRLNYYSIEKFPLKREDLKRATRQWNKFESLASILLDGYPPPMQGIWSIDFPKINLRLFLCWLDCIEGLQQLHQQNISIDCWYLDGFAPRKNHAMWQQSVFSLVARCSADQASFATFSAASAVRRGLTEVGFEVSKRPGFGRKREMLIGQFNSDNRLVTDLSNASNKQNLGAPWLRRPAVDKSNRVSSVAVIGGGIAGVTTACKLADQGFTVTLFEQSDRIASGASGASAGIYYPYLSADHNLTSQFFFAAYHRLLNDIQRYELAELTHSIGLVNLLSDTAKCDKLFNGFYPEDEFAPWFERIKPHILHHNLQERTGVFFPQSGYLGIKQVCEHLLTHSDVAVKLNTKITHINRQNSAWQCVISNEQSIEHDAVVVCNSFSAAELLPEHFLPAIKVRGQTCHLDLPGDAPMTKQVLSDTIYAIPLKANRLYLGATFDRQLEDEHLRLDSQTELIEQLSELLQYPLKTPETLTGRVGFRWCSVDRLPYVGPLPDFQAYAKHYSSLWHGKPAHHYQDAQYWPNLYINLAHGARGITSSWLSADLITSYMSGTAFPSHISLVNAVHPARGLVRELKKPAPKRLPGLQKRLAKRA